MTEELRQKFEDWAVPRYDVTRVAGGAYRWDYANDLWQCWQAASAQSGWRPIAEAPAAEHEPFLVYLPRTMAGTREVNEPCVVQVSRFEGQLYPDAMAGLIDWDDRITKATNYMPIPAAPHSIAAALTSNQITKIDTSPDTCTPAPETST